MSRGPLTLASPLAPPGTSRTTAAAADPTAGAAGRLPGTRRAAATRASAVAGSTPPSGALPRALYRALAVALALALPPRSVSAAPPRPVLLQGGTIHPVSAPAIEGGDVLIGRDGRIAAVGVGLAAPADARIIDVTGKVVTPGLVDACTRLGLAEVLAVQGTKDDDAGGDPVRAAFHAADGFNPASVAIPVARAQGVTSVIAMPTGGVVSGHSTWVDLDAPGMAWGSLGPLPVAMHINMSAGAIPLVGASRGALLLALRELFDDARFYRDHKALFDENRSRTLAASRLDLEALQPVLDGVLPLAAVARKASDIEAFLTLARETGARPVVLGGNEAWLVADRLAADKVPVIVQPLQNLPTGYDALGSRSDAAALLHAAGVRVILSTFNVFEWKHDVGTLRQVAGNAVRAGLPWDAALRAVTLTPAEVFERRDIGALEPGLRADVVVWSGDPFELSTAPESVWIAGREVPLESRQTLLFQRYRRIDRRGPLPAPRILPPDAAR